jgi:hypothetical protein
MAVKQVPQPRSKASMPANFEKRFRDMRIAAAQEYEARKAGGQVYWFWPADWHGHLNDVEGMSAPFGRDDANQMFLAAVKDPQNPGTTGDVVAVTTAIDTLAAMEQAFRARHCLRRPRATAHLLGRKRGHGDDRGPLTQNYVEYLRFLLKEARAK